MSSKIVNSKPNRLVFCDDTLNYLMTSENPIPGSVFTSLPDISELPHLFNNNIVNDTNKDLTDKDEIQLEVQKLYKEWFTNTVSLIFEKLHDGEYCIFLQSDVRCLDKSFKGNNVIEWIDKSYLISRAMENNKNIKLMWHKIVTTSENALTKLSAGRPSYSHLICYCKGNSKYPASGFATPDVFYRGNMIWAKGVGLNCALMGVAFLQFVKTNVIVDPFCGVGTILAMANAVGVDSIGIEISDRRCRKARRLSLTKQLHEMKPSLRRQLGLINYTYLDYDNENTDDNDDHNDNEDNFIGSKNDNNNGINDD